MLCIVPSYISWIIYIGWRGHEDALLSLKARGNPLVILSPTTTLTPFSTAFPSIFISQSMFQRKVWMQWSKVVCNETYYKSILTGLTAVASMLFPPFP